MARPTADMVEEALNLIERGELTLESGALRYGEQWVTIYPAVETALQVTQAANPPLVSQRSFTPLDKAAGWNALKAQLEATRPAPVVASRRPRVQPHPVYGWLEAITSFFGTRLGRASLGTMAGLAMVILLVIEINGSLPGDPLYRAKLGWDHAGELVNIDPNDRAQAAMNYADHRLNELERLAFVSTPEQVAEVQGQYLRGLDAGLHYTDNKNFTVFSSFYNRLNDQRDRVVRLQQIEYGYGPRSQLNILASKLDSGVLNISSKLPGGTPPPGPSPAAASTPQPIGVGTPAPNGTVKPAAPTSLLGNAGDSTGISRLLASPSPSASPSATSKS